MLRARFGRDAAARRPP